MKRETAYVSQTSRIAAAWLKAGRAVRLPPDVLQQIFLDNYSALGRQEFLQRVRLKKITRQRLLRGDSLKEWQARSDVEARKRADDPAQWVGDDPDNADRLCFELKQIIEVGDGWECAASKCLADGTEQLTKGQVYPIEAITDHGFGDFTITTQTNLPAPDHRARTSSYGVRRLYRHGRLIWAWRAAWIRDWDGRNQNNLFPREPADRALFIQLGWK